MLVKDIHKIQKINSWNTSVDLARIFAFLMLVSLHFFIWNEFYEYPVFGIRMYLFVNIRILSMTCIPIFLLITGFNMNSKTLSARHYFGLIRLIAIYALCGLTCLIFQTLFCDYIHPLTPYSGIRHTLNLLFSFELAPYGWYVGMYIGLFCLIPFLNILFKKLKTKKNKLILCLVLLLLTSAPALINNFNFSSGSLFNSFFNGSGVYSNLLPDYWKMMYPITYYFIGSYLKEFPIKISKILNLVLILVFLLIVGTYTYVSYYGKHFIVSDFHQWWSLTNIVLAVLIFNLFINISNDVYGNWVKKSLKNLSKLILGAYLLSYIFDIILSNWTKANIPIISDRLYYYIFWVCIVFLASILLSALVYFVYIIICKVFRCLYSFIAKLWKGRA